MVRKDLKGSFRIRSTEEDIGSVRYFRPADPTATPTEGATQRGSTQRGSTLKFTQTEALMVHGAILGDLRLPPGAPTGNTAAAESALGYPQKAPPVTAPETGADLWNARILQSCAMWYGCTIHRQNPLAFSTRRTVL